MIPIDVAAYPTEITGIIGIWVGLFIMLAIYSYPMYKETIVFRLAEHTFVATVMAIMIIVNIDSLLRTSLVHLFTGEQLYLIIPIILGFAMYALIFPDYRWISRYPIAILVGSSLGLGMAASMVPSIVSQVISTATVPTTGAAIDWFNFAFIAIGTLCAVSYFLLTYEHKGIVKGPTQLGRYFIMIGLGAYFGNTVLFRFAMLSGRALFFLQVLKIVPM